MKSRTKLCTAFFFLLALVCSKSAQAVEINYNGSGELLIFPYYTTTGDYDTYINLVNSSSDYKALKVRIRESMNGETVLAFNLYLSPYDHWSAVIYPTANINNQGAQLQTIDRSCTVPLAISEGEIIPLSSENYQADSVYGIERTREGFIEVIEMATIGPGVQDWPADILHTDGVPADCENLVAAWAPGGAWSNNALDGASRASGGLYGYGVLADVNEGTLATYDAVAIDNFTDPERAALHTAPDAVEPTLGSGDTHYKMLANGNYISGNAGSGIDAVSALLMQASIHNDFILEPYVAAATDWVITFPTKNFYTNDGTVHAPFLTAWNERESSACEPISFIYYNRESARPASPPVDMGWFPPPRQGLCAQANVLSIQPSSVKRSIFDASVQRNSFELVLEEGFVNGWGTLSFVYNRPVLDLGVVSMQGLPLVGFALHRFTNGQILIEGNPVLSNYVGVVLHKGEVVIDVQ